MNGYVTMVRMRIRSGVAARIHVRVPDHVTKSPHDIGWSVSFVLGYCYHYDQPLYHSTRVSNVGHNHVERYWVHSAPFVVASGDDYTHWFRVVLVVDSLQSFVYTVGVSFLWREIRVIGICFAVQPIRDNLAFPLKQTPTTVRRTMNIYPPFLVIFRYS